MEPTIDETKVTKFDSLLDDEVIQICAKTTLEHVTQQSQIEDVAHAVVNRVKIETTEATPILEIKIAINTLVLYVRAEANKMYLDRLEQARKQSAEETSE